ncbi:FecR family protein [uncultured Bacteroides sp.]|uniref:FecR family protein n=1 Tax=uncultured Bacteroides sp. TaxID=162156 RepID=UPI0025DB0229|nr:FecR domain-containing protein [uncultured Bacteroides sp.]
MDSKIDYSNYKADSLLNDAYFLESEQHPTQESILFWEKLSCENEQLAKEIAIARHLLHNLRHISMPPLPQQEVDDLWKRISEQNCKEILKKRKRLILYRTLAAACIVILLVGGWYLQNSYQTIQNVELPDIASIKKPDISANQTLLILSERKQIALKGKESKLDYNQQGKVNVDSQTINLIAENKEKKDSYNQLIVPTGKRSSITFADGTHIWLSASSRVVYPVEFSEHKREIYVEGEVFLDVSSDKNRPFVVKTNKMDVQVLGTTFNVCAYEGENTQTVVLVTGKVEVKTNKNETKVLTPNNLLAYDDEKGISVEPVDVQDYIAWKDGFYQFKQENLGVIAKRLSKYYGKTIIIDEQLTNITCSGKLDLKEELDDVLRTLIQTVPAQVKKSNDQIYINVKSK